VIKYTVQGSADYLSDGSPFFASIFTNLAVYFGAGTINGQLSRAGRNFLSGSSGGLPSVGVSGQIVGNEAIGETNNAAYLTQGRYGIRSIGPAADELILTYVAENPNSTLIGAAVGVRNPLL
jgi:hypothetical protein